MGYELSLDILIALVAAVGFGLTAIYVVLARRHRPTWVAGAVLLSACAEITAAHAIQRCSTDLAARIFWYKMIYLGFTVTPTAFLFLGLRFGRLDYVLKRYSTLPLFMIPVITTIVIFTNEKTGLMWNPADTLMYANSSGFLTRSSAGIWYWLFLSYSYLMMGLACYFLIRLLIRSRSVYGRQISVVIAGASLAILGSLLDITRLSPLPSFSTTALGLAFGSISVVYALSPLRRLDMISATREIILNSISDAIIAVDSDRRILNFNLAAEKLIGKPISRTIDRPLEQLLPALSPFLARDTSMNSEVTLYFGQAQRVYELRISVIQGWQGHIEGDVIVLRDITERKKSEAELLAKQEADRKFAEKLSALIAIANELSEIRTFDDFCRRVVEAGRDQLGFDRLSLWFLDDNQTTMQGAYGTDADGRTTDERYARYPISKGSRLNQLINGNQTLQLFDNATLYQRGTQIGFGSRISASFRDGKKVVGFISVDNLINREPFTEQDCNLLRLYASALGNLYALKRNQIIPTRQQNTGTMPD